jgi:hypothetical protein
MRDSSSQHTSSGTCHLICRYLIPKLNFAALKIPTLAPEGLVYGTCYANIDFSTHPEFSLGGAAAGAVADALGAALGLRPRFFGGASSSSSDSDSFMERFVAGLRPRCFSAGRSSSLIKTSGLVGNSGLLRS